MDNASFQFFINAQPIHDNMGRAGVKWVPLPNMLETENTWGIRENSFQRTSAEGQKLLIENTDSDDIVPGTQKS